MVYILNYFIVLLIVIASGGILHIYYGNELTVLLVISLILKTIINQKDINRGSFRRFIISEIFIVSIFIFNYIIHSEMNYQANVSILLRYSLMNYTLLLFAREKYLLRENIYYILITLLVISYTSIIVWPFVAGHLPVDIYSRYGNILLIINYSSTFNIGTLYDLPRIQAIFWEPGILGIFLNILLYELLFNRERKRYSAFVIIIIISTFSTVAYIIMFLQILVYIGWYMQKKN